MTKLNEELAQVADLLSVLDKGRATTKDFEEFANALLTFVKTFIDSTKAEKEAFMARVEKHFTDKLARIKEGKDGEKGADGKDGKDGKDGRDGMDGLNGKDADPDEIAALVLSMLPEEKEYLGEDFRNALEALPEGEKLSMSAIEGLEEALKKIKSTRGMSAGGSSAPFGSISHSPIHEQFTMDGVATSVTLSAGVAANGKAAWVHYNGQFLANTTSYTVDGNKITFVGFVPEADTTIEVVYIP